VRHGAGSVVAEELKYEAVKHPGSHSGR
jgi:hypothetical protein